VLPAGVVFFFKKKLTIYYMGREGRLWQVHSTYLNTREGEKRERKRKQYIKGETDNK